MAGRVIAHIPNPYEFKAAPVLPKDVIAPQAEDSALPEFCTSIQVSEPAEFSEVTDQFNKTVLRKEVRHALALRALCVI